MAAEAIDDTDNIVTWTDYVGDAIDIQADWGGFDLTGYSGSLDLRGERGTTATVLVSATVTLGSTNPNITISLSSVNTTSLGVGTYYGALVIIDTLSKPDTKFILKLKLKSR